MKSRPRAKSKKQQKRELYIAFGVLVLLFTLISSCVNAVFGDDEDPYVAPVATVSERPSTVSVPSHSAPAWTVSPQPTRTAKTKRPAPTKTRTRTVKPRPKPEQPSLPSVHPGAFCSGSGAQGLYKGRIYTCKGPKPLRWRR